MINHVKEYFKAVCEAYRLGNIETSFNAPILTLLSEFGCSARDLSGERSRQAGENIDIKLWRSQDEVTETEPFAGVEVKKVNGIDARARDQIKKEAALYGYAILTDNIRWEFWRAGEDKMYSGVLLMEINDGKLALKEENVELFITLMHDFLLQDPTQIKSSSKLAEYMAIHAKTIRSVIIGILKEDENGMPAEDKTRKIPLFPELYGLFGRIQMDLRPMLNTRSFADMYAQTVVYGLFIARYNDAATGSFNRYEAISKLRKESALLNRFFEHITNTGANHPTLDVVIDKLCSLYQTCNISALLDNDERRDTIVHFYEDFLTFYDPALRKSLGVFYTPHQVVRYLVSQVDKHLIEDFGIQGGLSNNDHYELEVSSQDYIEKKKTMKKKKISVPRVAILDPATGTGTFLAEIIKYIKVTYFSGMREAFYNDYIKKEDGLLSRLIGFEIMMTSYAVAHLNVRRSIEETIGNIPDEQLPTNIFLTNTLAKPNSELERVDQMSLFDFSAAISDEAYNADTWKTRRPIKVVIGNPPYLAESINPYDISEYKTEADGISKLDSKNSKLLGDDYVKFFRFAEQLISKNNDGILAYVSNNGFLDNPSFRGMRASLLRVFDKIYIVDLHGSAKKQETAPDGSRDENVFDIMQGVSLFIGVKSTNNSKWATLYHADLYGVREVKFEILLNGLIDYQVLTPDKKMAYFVPFCDSNLSIYEKGVSITDLFTSFANGIQTGNVNVSVADSKAEMQRRVNICRNATSEDEIVKLWGTFGSSQTAKKIQDDVLSSDGTISQMHYRPFDIKWTYYTGKSSGWLKRPGKLSIMGQLTNAENTPIGRNIGIVFSKQTTQRYAWDGIFVADYLVDLHLIDYPAKSAAYVAPLYLRPEGLEREWTPNISQEHFLKLIARLECPPTLLDVFDYVYGILFDPVYRAHFAEYLSRDFPRVPIINAPKKSDDDFVVTEEMFTEYVKAGEKLRKLHLLQTKIPATLAIDPNNSDDLEIGAIKYKDGVLQLNPKKKLLGIPEDAWNYRIGGYQVLDKWFKSHKGRTMNIDDFDHIANVVGLLAETIRIQDGLRELHKQT